MPLLPMTATQAEARMHSAEAAWLLSKEHDDVNTAHEMRAAYDGAKAAYSLILTNEAADRHVAEGSDPISRDILIAELNESIPSAIAFGAAIVDALEEAQRYFGHFTRMDCRARAADGSWRAPSANAYVCALEILEAYCPMLAGRRLGTPWRVKLDETGKVVPEANNA